MKGRGPRSWRDTCCARQDPDTCAARSLVRPSAYSCSLCHPLIHLQLLIPSESAHDTIEAIGRLGKLQFRDLNENQAAFSKTFASQVKRCDEMRRQLVFIQEQVEKAELPIGSGLVFGNDNGHVELDVLESRLARLEKEILQLVENSEQLERSYHELHELQLVLETAGSFFDDSRSRAGTMDDPSSRESTYWLGAPM